ncbi:M48 family metalloprotease [Coralloluteibacterium thermophilus]|uniref:M48 family metalloprotease n=1 Tax=Coralloluteibacterium thermophilum TaxID=2707049 RepID=A0ABV9NGC7_9GAMM
MASLWAVAVLCLLMPVAYFASIGAIGWLEFAYYSRWAPAPGTIRGIGLLMAWIIPGFVGLVLVLFLLKPLFAPRPRPPRAVELDPVAEPELFEAVRALCAAIGVQAPVAIEISHEPNAWVRFDDGLGAFLAGRKRLAIGLPLVAGMDVRQFVGVLAHEFGHFAQGGGMRSASLVHRVNRWLESRAYEPDAWDERLARWGENSPLLPVSVAILVAQACLWLTRGLLRLLFHASLWISGRLSQEMEFDADRYEASVSGSAVFRESALRLRGLARACDEVADANHRAWREGRLVADLPAAAIARMSQWGPEVWDELALGLRNDEVTRYWASHPADQARIANAEALAAPGLVHDVRPAHVLFRDLPALSRRVTEHFYSELGLEVDRRNLIEVDALLGLNRIDPGLELSWRRWSNGMLGDVPLMSPRVAALAPYAGLGWQDCVDELRRMAPEAGGLWQRLARRRAERRDATLWIALIDLDVDFVLPDGRAPDPVELRTVHAAGAATDTPDARLATRILALFARRLQHATAAAGPAQAMRLRAGLDLLQALRDASPAVLDGQDEREALLRLQCGIPAENHALRAAAQERADARLARDLALLERLDAIVLDGGQHLGKRLRSRFGHLSAAAGNVWGQLEAMLPLEDVFLQVYRTELAALGALALDVETAQGIRPIRLVEFDRAPAAVPA